MLFSKDGVGQRFQRVSDQIPYRLRVGRILVSTALRISNDAVVNGVDFEPDLSIRILHRQREAWGDRPTVRRPRERRTFRNRPVGPTLTVIGIVTDTRHSWNRERSLSSRQTP